MNDADVSKQIQQMVRFIRQEAEEKANEISISAEEEFNIERLQLLESAKRKLRQDYDRKLKQVDIRKRMSAFSPPSFLYLLLILLGPLIHSIICFSSATTPLN